MSCSKKVFSSISSYSSCHAAEAFFIFIFSSVAALENSFNSPLNIRAHRQLTNPNAFAAKEIRSDHNFHSCTYVYIQGECHTHSLLVLSLSLFLSFFLYPFCSRGA